MELRTQPFATYLLIFLLSALCHSQVTYEDSFPDLSFEFPTEIMTAGDNSGRMFVVEQTGRIKVFQNSENTSIADTYLDISDIVSFSSGQEIGLLGLAFHPDYPNNGYFYVYHTRESSLSGVYVEIVLARYTVSEDDPDLADPSSRLEIFSFDKNQGNSNHNGGKIAFGPDGYLYASFGDGGGGGDPNGNAQNLDNVFGSILRIDVDLDGNNPLESNPDTPNGNYEIPSDNPRAGQSGLDELFAWGIRNTWKFSFDEPTGLMWGADVGQGDREEINLIVKGGNYGWNRFEGNTVEDASTVLATTPDIKPVFEYDRSNGDVSITGGYVYRGASNNPQIKEKYIYGDYITGRVWALDYNPSNGEATSEFLFRTNGQYISSFGLDEAGELYFSDYGTSSKLYKIIGGNNGPQTVTVNGVGDWYGMAEGTNGNVKALAVPKDGPVYIGGEFTTAGAIATADLAIYDPVTGWEGFDSASNGSINSIAIGNRGNIYVGGDFSQIGGIQANNIALWNGSWSALGQGTNGPVAEIGIGNDDKIYVGGTFETAGGAAVNNIALWSNNTWMPMVDGATGTPGTNNEVRAITIDTDGLVYVGGNFDAAGGNTAPRIAVWDGTNWGTLGSGTSGFVQAMAITQDYIYAGGNFAVAGNVTANRIARWDRSSQQWETLGYGLSGNVNALAHNGSHLYAGGNFQTASDQENINKVVNNIARWSEDQGWQALGNGTAVGVDKPVNKLAFDNQMSSLYVGGTFGMAGENNAGNVALWGFNLGCINNIIPEYTINGSTDSGLNEITLQEGSEIKLSILPKDIDFSIELVDGTTVVGDHTINSLLNSDQGTYTFTTPEGCIATLQIIVESTNMDSDNDGVPDNIDQCPNSPPLDLVDNIGCTVVELPLDNYVISATGLTCKASGNGTITISSNNKNIESTAIIIGGNLNKSYTFTDYIEITDLPSSLYEICFTNNRFPNYNNCSKIVITEPEELLVTSILDKENNVVTLKMSGAKNYKINHNGLNFNTNENTLHLDIKDNVNVIKVSTDEICQGIHEEIISLKSSIAYPNPFDNNVNITAFTKSTERVEILIYSSLGVLILSNVYDYQDGVVQIETPYLSAGVYYVLVNNGETLDSHKIVKQ